MSLAIVRTRALLGVNAPAVTVETHLSNGLPGFTIVGLPETAVRESKDRVRSALINSHFEFPQRRITVNLAPADLPKEGARFDLAIALGILAASEQIPSASLEGHEFIGELALSGELRYVRGSISTAMAAEQCKSALIIPSDCEAEASLCQYPPLYHAENLLQVCAYLHGREGLPNCEQDDSYEQAYDFDLNEVKGQAHAKRALEIAASGGHNLLLFGSPGTGKSMLASRLPSILPKLTRNEAIELAAIHSVASRGKTGREHEQFYARPYRSPHHSASSVSLVGGGPKPLPGEISLAHHGVLFLDEFPEYKRSVIEALREPMESGEIHLSRASTSLSYPAQFQLVAAMNPCPCGHYGDGSQRCQCTPTQVLKYKDKISGPMLDRIDLQVQVNKLSPEELQAAPSSVNERSDEVRHRVEACRHLQLDRQAVPNARLNNRDLTKYAQLDKATANMLTNAIERLQLSPRAYDRILRISRTIADLEASAPITKNHVAEALSYRNFDRFYARLSQF